MRALLVLIFIVFAPAIAAAQADQFPSRPITILVPFPPGGSSDVTIRQVAQKAAEILKVNIVIDNRSGGGGTVAALATLQATADGYTLFLANNGLFAITPALGVDMRFDPVKDFAPITPVVKFPSVLMVPVGLPAKSVKELVELSKSRDKGLSFASQGVGSGGQVLAEMLRLKSGGKFVHIPYRGAGPAVTDIAAGNVDLLFGSYVSVAGQVAAGKVRLLGWTAPNRSPAIPDVPTMAEAGFPGVELEIWHGVMAPAGTPPAVVKKLNEAFVTAARTPDIVSKVAAQAAEIFTSTPEEYAKLIASDRERLGKAVRDAGIKLQ